MDFGVGKGKGALVDLRQRFRINNFLLSEFLDEVLANLQNVFLIATGLRNFDFILHSLESEHEVVKYIEDLLICNKTEQLLGLLAQGMPVVNIAVR